MEPIDSPMKPRPWTHDEDNYLRQHALDGWSARDIAAPIGRSKNSVIGRASRLGIKLHGKNHGGWRPRRKVPLHDRLFREDLEL